MDWTNRRERFRATLDRGRCIHPASVYDPISARIAEDLGFEAGMLAGSVASLAVLGAPDIVLLTLTEFAAQAYRVNRAGNLPLLVDADHGYGNALNVKRTVEELETAGVVGLTIEDTLLPTPYGATETRLIPIEEAVGKMRAALAGRQDPPRHRRPYRRGHADRDCRRHCAAQGLRGRWRRHAVHRRREIARRA
jgi:oxaloacetate decarboxylase